MKRNSELRIIAAVCFLVFMAAGCATGRENPVDTSAFTIEKVSSDRARLSNVGVYEDNEDLVVRGLVKRKGITIIPDKGIVEVLVIDPTGEILAAATDRYTPRFTRKKKTARFSVRFSDPFPEGCIVRVAHRSSPEECITTGDRLDSESSGKQSCPHLFN